MLSLELNILECFIVAVCHVHRIELDSKLVLASISVVPNCLYI